MGISDTNETKARWLMTMLTLLSSVDLSSDGVMTTMSMGVSNAMDRDHTMSSYNMV